MTARSTRYLWVLAISAAAVASALAVLGSSMVAPVAALFADADDASAVARGRAIYAARCAGCHGTNLEGQKNWQTVGANGRLPAPPQDERGHSWMHSDEFLFRIVKFSVRDTAAPDYVSDMPAFAADLSDADIVAVLAYIKSRWPIGVRVYQAALNPGTLGMPQGSHSGDWKLPEDCGWEPNQALAPRD